MSRDGDVQRICEKLEKGKWQEASANRYFSHELAKMAESAEKGGTFLRIDDFDSVLTREDRNKIGWPHVEFINESPYRTRETKNEAGKKSVAKPSDSADPDPVGMLKIYIFLGGGFLCFMWCSLSGDWHWRPGERETAIKACIIVTCLFGLPILVLAIDCIKQWVQHRK